MKSKKKLHSKPICKLLGKQEFLENALLSLFHIFSFPIFSFCCAKFQKKLANQVQEKLVTYVLTNEHTDLQTHRQA